MLSRLIFSPDKFTLAHTLGFTHSSIHSSMMMMIMRMYFKECCLICDLFHYLISFSFCILRWILTFKPRLKVSFCTRPWTCVYAVNSFVPRHLLFTEASVWLTCVTKRRMWTHCHHTAKHDTRGCTTSTTNSKRRKTIGRMWVTSVWMLCATVWRKKKGCKHIYSHIKRCLLMEKLHTLSRCLVYK